MCNLAGNPGRIPFISGDFGVSPLVSSKPRRQDFIDRRVKTAILVVHGLLFFAPVALRRLLPCQAVQYLFELDCIFEANGEIHHTRPMQKSGMLLSAWLVNLRQPS